VLNVPKSLTSEIISECFKTLERNSETILCIDFEPDEILINYGIQAAKHPEKANENAEAIVENLAAALKKATKGLNQKPKFKGRILIVEDKKKIGQIDEPSLEKMFTDVLEEYIHYLEEHIKAMPRGSRPRKPDQFLNALEERLLHAQGAAPAD
jgi:uncharacterized protein YicC (UPF0701 family)